MDNKLFNITGTVHRNWLTDWDEIAKEVAKDIDIARNAM